MKRLSAILVGAALCFLPTLAGAAVAPNAEAHGIAVAQIAATDMELFQLKNAHVLHSDQEVQEAWWQSIQQVAVSAGSSFQGPGDVVSGAIAWGSCARVYNAVSASTATSLCDLKDKTTGTVAICTLRGSSTGFVDLAGTYCTGSATPATACAAAAGGSCVVSKVYDETGTGNDFTQATPANMPGLVFNALNGLPGLQCGSPVILATPALTQAQPFSLSTTYIRTSGTAIGAAIGAQSGGILLASDLAANGYRVTAGSPFLAVGAPDNAWHSLEGTFAAGATGGANLDGTDNPNLTLGSNAFAANTLRLCSDATQFLVGRVMEGGIWPTGFTPTQRGNISSNQHSATNGYNF